MKKFFTAAIIFGVFIGGIWIVELTGIAKPDCEKVYPQGLAVKAKITKYYEKMAVELNANDYTNAYETYKLLNIANNEIDDLMSTDGNYDCFLDADYPESTYEWFQKNPGNEFGGELKSLCVLWGIGCTESKPRFTNPCDEYTLTEDYIDCIEDNARPGPNYEPY
jgi:hypothetical protein